MLSGGAASALDTDISGGAAKTCVYLIITWALKIDPYRVAVPWYLQLVESDKNVSLQESMKSRFLLYRSFVPNWAALA